MHARLSLLLLVVLALAFAPAPLPRPERRAKPVPGMEGLWQGGHRLLITATHLIYNPEGGKTEYELVVDRTAQPPSYDLRFPGSREVSWLGIWKVEGDTLTLCYQQTPAGRPTRFDEGKGITEVYKLVKR
jgi:uncharacterized protein (TIGR03067 family)